MTRRALREAREREAKARRALLFGARASWWLLGASVLSVVAVACFALVGTRIAPPLAWASLGAVLGLLAATVTTAVVLPRTLRRATLFAWLLTGLVGVSLGSTCALMIVDHLA